MACKVGQNVKFLRRQPYVAAFDLDAVGLRIYAEMTNFNHVRFERLCCRKAPKPGSDPCQQFIHAERFRDVVISAGIERLDLRALLVSYRKHDDGNSRLRSKMAAKLDTVHVGHPKVGDHEVGCPRFHHLQCIVAIGSGSDRISARGERGFEDSRNLQLIVYDQDLWLLAHGSHRATSPLASRCVRLPPARHGGTCEWRKGKDTFANWTAPSDQRQPE